MVLRPAEVINGYQANLKLKSSKCQLYWKDVSFVGHVVSAEGVTMQPEIVRVVQKWPRCRKLTELHALLGTCGYYHRFIREFSDIAALLNQLLREDAPFCWMANCQAAFEQLKAKLLEEPVLALRMTMTTTCWTPMPPTLGSVLCSQKSRTRRRRSLPTPPKH